MTPGDPEFSTLTNLAGAHRFNSAMFALFEDKLGRRVLDAGAGVGTFTARLLEGNHEPDLVVAADIDERSLEVLRCRFAGQANVLVRQVDLNCVPVQELRPLRLDSVLCLNVLEHVQDDRAALGALHDVVIPDGRLLLLVPAHELLYGALDVALHHFRRYERAQLTRLLGETGWLLESIRPFNLPGLLGWMASSRLLRRQTVSVREVVAFDKWAAPLLRWERRLRIPIGASFAVVARAR